MFRRTGTAFHNLELSIAAQRRRNHTSHHASRINIHISYHTTMRKFNFAILQAFLALTLISHCTTPVTLSTFSKQKNDSITMADAWIPIHQHGRGRNLASRGRGGRGGRLAPAAAGRGPRHPALPSRAVSRYITMYPPPPTIYSTHSYRQAPIPTHNASPWTWPTIKKSQWPQNHGCLRPYHGLILGTGRRILLITTFTNFVSLERS